MFKVCTSCVFAVKPMLASVCEFHR